MFAVLDIQNKFHIQCCHVFFLSPYRNLLALLQCFIAHRHQISSAERHNIKCHPLCYTKDILDTFWFLLQVCRNLLETAESGDVNTVKILFKCTNDSCTTDDQDRFTPLGGLYKPWVRSVEIINHRGNYMCRTFDMSPSWPDCEFCAVQFSAQRPLSSQTECNQLCL